MNKKRFDELIDRIIENKIEALVNQRLDYYFSDYDESEDKCYACEEPKKKSCNIDVLNEPEKPGTNYILSGAEEVTDSNKPEYDTLNEVKKGWVETTNGYMDIIESMKRALTKEQLELIATPREFVSAKEFEFHRFIDNMTWDDLSKIFKNNKYMPINIDFDDDQKNKFMICGTTPQMIYITLLTNIVKAEVVKMTKSEKNYDPEKYALHAIILGAYHELYNNDIVNTLTNIILAKCHMEVFDDVFGEQWYAQFIDLREIYADKINKKEDGTGEEIHTPDNGTDGQEDVG